MKKYIILSLLLCFMITESYACDICGCGVGSYYIGILPDFSKKIIGLRYRYNTLRTHIGAGGSTSYLTTDETYRTAEVWGGWTIGARFRLMAYIPVGFNEKFNQGVSNTKSGIGDAGIQGFYQLLDRRNTIGSKLVIHSLWAGAGIKLPAGKYEPSERNNFAQNANLFQLGTGSTDFTVNAMYDLRIQDAGLNTAASYKINTANKYDYRYGNKFSGVAQLYYKFRIKNRLTISPNAGAVYESAQKDTDGKFSMDVSGGHLLLGSAGIEASFKKIAIGANYQIPVSQQLAGGFVKANNRGMLHVSFMF